MRSQFADHKIEGNKNKKMPNTPKAGEPGISWSHA